MQRVIKQIFVALFGVVANTVSQALAKLPSWSGPVGQDLAGLVEQIIHAGRVPLD